MDNKIISNIKDNYCTTEFIAFVNYLENFIVIFGHSY